MYLKSSILVIFCIVLYVAQNREAMQHGRIIVQKTQTVMHKVAFILHKQRRTFLPRFQTIVYRFFHVLRNVLTLKNIFLRRLWYGVRRQMSAIMMFSAELSMGPFFVTRPNPILTVID